MTENNGLLTPVGTGAIAGGTKGIRSILIGELIGKNGKAEMVKVNSCLYKIITFFQVSKRAWLSFSASA
jgi:hypothetical protein